MRIPISNCLFNDQLRLDLSEYLNDQNEIAVCSIFRGVGAGYVLWDKDHA